MLSRIERCRSEVSCVTMAMAARRLSWVTLAMSCPSIRMRPLSRSCRRRSSDDERGLAGAARADEPDLLAGPDGEVEIVDDAVLTAVMEATRPRSGPRLRRPRAAWRPARRRCRAAGRSSACSPGPRRHSRRRRARICITQPDMARMRMTSAMPVAASPLVMAPRVQSRMDKPPVATSRTLFMTDSTSRLR